MGVWVGVAVKVGAAVAVAVAVGVGVGVKDGVAVSSGAVGVGVRGGCVTTTGDGGAAVGTVGVSRVAQAVARSPTANHILMFRRFIITSVSSTDSLSHRLVTQLYHHFVAMSSGMHL